MRRKTRQKKILHDEIKHFKSFFNAYELHSRAVNKDRSIGLATVYRFLNHMKKDGMLHSFLCDNKKIFSTEKTNHTHFRCKKCGLLKHINIKNVDFLSELTDHDICHFQIELTGTCSNCK